jgi:hypothetical protein
VKRRVAFLIPILSLGLILPSLSQDGAPSPEDQAKMMARYKQAMTPGKQHKGLMAKVGKWKVTSKLFMEGPGTKAAVTQASATFSSALGGRFLKQDYKGISPFGPFEGIGYQGYDNFRKQYVGTWMDSGGTTVSFSRGIMDPKGKVIRYYGVMDEPMTGEVSKPVMWVVRDINADKFVFEVHDLVYGAEGMVVELTYERDK